MQETLDLRGLRCPLPVLKTRKAVKSMAAGALVDIWVTDQGAPEDLKDFCTVTGHEWLSSDPLETHTVVRLRLAS